MQNVMQIDYKQSYGKVVSINPAKQKVFFKQNGIDYNSAGVACDPKQIKAHYAKIAVDAQKSAEEAVTAAEAAQAEVAEIMKAGSVTKSDMKKAASA